MHCSNDQHLEAEYVRMVESVMNADEPSEEPCEDKLTYLLKFHLHDWIIFGVLVVTNMILNAVHPYRRYINMFMVGNLSYPHKGDTIPFWSVQIVSFFLPLLIMGFVFSVKKNIRDLHHGILGLVFTLAITAVLTDAVKVAVGRPRPDFMNLCFPKGFSSWTFDMGNGDVLCSPDASRASIEEGYRSFPSGHTSWSFAGLGYLSWYLAGKLALYDKAGHPGKLPLVLSPLLLATLVAISRVDDYRHHWQDVVVGGLLGFGVATIIYHQHFPPIHVLESGRAFNVMRLAPSRTMDANMSKSPPTLAADVEAGTIKEKLSRCFEIVPA